MAFEKDPRPTEEEGLNGNAGRKKYGKLVRMFREGFLSVCVYKNAYEHKVFYDIVIYRKIKSANGSFDYRRGTNLKPTDLPTLEALIKEAQDFLTSLESENNPAR